MDEKNYYLIRVGEGSKYINEAHKKNFVAIGWDKVPNLQQLGSFENIKEALSKAPYKYTPAQLSAQAGQLYRFGLEMKNGDIVISPIGSGEYFVGVVGDYYYEEKPGGQCHYKHRREVAWKETKILKEDMSTNLSYAVGALMTIFSIKKYANELDNLITGEPYTPAEKPQRVRDIVLSGLKDLNAKEFEEFIRHVLSIIGFSAETTQYVGDGGIDVNGVLNAEGLANITLRVQTKRKDRAVSNKDVRDLRGTLCQGEHGCLITISKFTKQASEEAESPGKIPIKLIDGNDLSGLILRHFDEIDEEYKVRFGIRRKKDFNIEDQFEPIDQKESDVMPGITDEEIKKPNWDSLLCAAQEDGFKRAFLGKNAWWAVRINSKFIPYIKYIAIYQVAPISKITYYGEIDRIEPYQDSGKYIIYLKKKPEKLKTPVGLGENPYLKPQGPRYAKLNKILKAKTLDDVF